MPTLLTNLGKALLVSRIMGTGSEPKYIGWGTGTTDAAAGDTALEAEAAEARVNGTSSQVTTTTTNDTYRVTGTMTAIAARAITEAGLFTAATAGTLFIRGTFPVINLEAGDSIQLTIDAQVT